MSRSASAAPRSPATVVKRGEEFGLLADLGEYLRSGVLGDVMRDGERAIGSTALGVHAPLGDHVAVEMGELLQVPHVLKQLRTTRSGGHHVLVVGDGTTWVGRQLLAHVDLHARL